MASVHIVYTAQLHIALHDLACTIMRCNMRDSSSVYLVGEYRYKLSVVPLSTDLPQVYNVLWFLSVFASKPSSATDRQLYFNRSTREWLHAAISSRAILHHLLLNSMERYELKTNISHIKKDSMTCETHMPNHTVH